MAPVSDAEMVVFVGFLGLLVVNALGLLLANRFFKEHAEKHVEEARDEDPY